MRVHTKGGDVIAPRHLDSKTCDFTTEFGRLRGAATSCHETAQVAVSPGSAKFCAAILPNHHLSIPCGIRSN